jgi:hypothetical protein
MAEKKGKYGDLISKSRAGKPDSQQASEPEKVDEVNLCVRVPKSHRQWWAGQSKLSGRSMTDVIKAALIKEFGLPPS